MNYEGFEDMISRALEVADLRNKVWKRSESYTFVSHDGEYIVVGGWNNHNEWETDEFPAHYMNLSNDEIVSRESDVKEIRDTELAEEQAKADAKAKNLRRGLYIQLNKEFRNERFLKDKD